MILVAVEDRSALYIVRGRMGEASRAVKMPEHSTVLSCEARGSWPDLGAVMTCETRRDLASGDS